MVLNLEILVDERHLPRLATALRRLRWRLKPMLRRGINSMLSGTRRQIVRELASQIDVPERSLESSIIVHRSRLPGLVGTLFSSARRRRLIELDAVQTSRGVTYRAAHGRKLIPHAFIAKRRAGGRAVFLRRRAARLPIDEQSKPSARQALENDPGIVDDSLAAPSERAWQTLIAELDREIRKLDA